MGASESLPLYMIPPLVKLPENPLKKSAGGSSRLVGTVEDSGNVFNDDVIWSDVVNEVEEVGEEISLIFCPLPFSGD